MPVMVREVIRYLNPCPGNTIVDCTVGGGGHALALLEAVGPAGALMGIDCDAETLAVVSRRLSSWSNFTPCHANFRGLSRVLVEFGWPAVDGILMDLGFSSVQVDTPERGFSFTSDGPLDMRLDRRRERTAADMIRTLSEKELATIFKRFGEEPFARRIARAVVKSRKQRSNTRTGELKALVLEAIPHVPPVRRRLAVRRAFMALRIALNAELENLSEAVSSAAECLRPGGRMVVLTYHSLEDRIVKHTFLDLAGRCTCPPGLPECCCGRRTILKILTAKPIIPEEGEVRDNPRSRSAKLRAVERLS